MEQIDPNDLLVFARVVAEGSLTAAADKLGLPKSTVSRRLSRLEELLGERLLLRTTRRLNITEFGAALLDHARQLESEVEAVAALAESRQARPSGRLRVSMPSDFANLLLTDMLAAFAALHPAVTLELDLSPRRVDLLGENFDLAIRLGDLPDDALLAARRLAVFPWGLYAAPAYLAEHGEPRAPDDLHRHRALRLLARTGDAIRWNLRCGEQRWEGVPPGSITANSPELLAGPTARRSIRPAWAIAFSRPSTACARTIGAWSATPTGSCSRVLRPPGCRHRTAMSSRMRRQRPETAIRTPPPSMKSARC